MSGAENGRAPNAVIAVVGWLWWWGWWFEALLFEALPAGDQGRASGPS